MKITSIKSLYQTIFLSKRKKEMDKILKSKFWRIFQEEKKKTMIVHLQKDDFPHSFITTIPYIVPQGQYTKINTTNALPTPKVYEPMPPPQPRQYSD